jgi:hypothetical protein
MPDAKISDIYSASSIKAAFRDGKDTNMNALFAALPSILQYCSAASRLPKADDFAVLKSSKHLLNGSLALTAISNKTIEQSTIRNSILAKCTKFADIVGHTDEIIKAETSKTSKNEYLHFDTFFRLCQQYNRAFSQLINSNLTNEVWLVEHAFHFDEMSQSLSLSKYGNQTIYTVIFIEVMRKFNIDMNAIILDKFLLCQVSSPSLPMVSAPCAVQSNSISVDIVSAEIWIASTAAGLIEVETEYDFESGFLIGRSKNLNQSMQEVWRFDVGKEGRLHCHQTYHGFGNEEVVSSKLLRNNGKHCCHLTILSFACSSQQHSPEGLEDYFEMAIDCEAFLRSTVKTYKSSPYVTHWVRKKDFHKSLLELNANGINIITPYSCAPMLQRCGRYDDFWSYCT